MSSALPNLVIIGVAKGGTTSLFHYLAGHGDICASQVKELDYFAPLRRPGGQLEDVHEYARHFTHCADQRYRMEASPSYCYGGAPVVTALQQTLHNPRVIISIREPVARFWSAYTFLDSMGRLPAAMTCEQYMAECVSQSSMEGRHTPLSVGRYVDYLPTWRKAFGDDFRVVFAEHLFAKPDAVVANLLQWLRIPPLTDGIDYETHNPTRRPRSQALGAWAYRAKDVSDRLLENAPGVRSALRQVYRRVNTRPEDRSLPDTDRARLAQYYAEPNAQLADFLHELGLTEFPAWLRDAL